MTDYMTDIAAAACDATNASIMIIDATTTRHTVIFDVIESLNIGNLIWAGVQDTTSVATTDVTADAIQTVTR
jgi:hypothetical protein